MVPLGRLSIVLLERMSSLLGHRNTSILLPPARRLTFPAVA